MTLKETHNTSSNNPAEASITTNKASEAKTNLFVFISEP